MLTLNNHRFKQSFYSLFDSLFTFRESAGCCRGQGHSGVKDVFYSRPPLPNEVLRDLSSKELYFGNRVVCLFFIIFNCKTQLLE